MTKHLKLESQNKLLKKRNFVLEKENKRFEKYLKSLNRQLLKEYHKVKEKLELSQELIKNLSSENERLTKANHDLNSKSQNQDQEIENQEKTCDQPLKDGRKELWMINQTKFHQNIRYQNETILSLTKSLHQKDEIIKLLKNRIEEKNELSFKMSEKFKTALNKIS